ncbi:DUF5689 domain-containing protein [Zobellia galactanivorans]|uniref:DUF5689 domain-containing protein n=1 Tax=Zobellia galactanivorans (strain DSM 12802 / CCUG 47099 / CIP 106680 / NCIMB 13871 / Dsij) TaxID=63186 RepID=UPI0026E3547C|nr:DUF5689 domain-containing protein [Zobellia galactanivorans]MDO6808328.1 DUF5689 domain-containing protein [Zobellia galactanivorans]
MRNTFCWKRVFMGFSALMVVWLAACVKNRSYDVPPVACLSNVKANATYSEVKNLYKGETIQIQEDLIIEGFVVSSDAAGNFFSVLYFQDSPSNPTQGFQIEIDLRDSHLFYPVGSKIGIKLKGLYLGKSKDVFKLGGSFMSFGNISVGRLPAAVVNEHIFRFCNGDAVIEPTQIVISDIEKEQTNTLVTLNDVEFVENVLEQNFAEVGEETERLLTDCADKEIVVLNSGFSDFQSETLPDGRGRLTGVLLRENDSYMMRIRNLDDIDFDQERCAELIDEFTSEHILISELADPDNNASARFVELYNASDGALSLKGWTLERYTNANTEVGSKIDLSPLTIDAGGYVVISPNAAEFESVYGFSPDLAVGTNSPADSNGDDNLRLVDPFDTVIDVFGVVGEDGSGTDHEFEDGRAVRKPEILKGSTTYDFKEWHIFNDSGDAGTTRLPQKAPDDFTPKNQG